MARHTIENKEPRTIHTDAITEKPNYTYQRDKDREPVKGIFRYHEVPGGILEFSFKAYKGDNIEKYSFIDGEIYTVPLGVARHLNRNVSYPVHAHITDKDGKPMQIAKTMVRRCSFQSLEFVDIDDLTPLGTPLTLVENI